MGCAGIFGGPVTQSHMKECIANVFVVELGGELVEGDVGDGVEEDGGVIGVGDGDGFGEALGGFDEVGYLVLCSRTEGYFCEDIYVFYRMQTLIGIRKRNKNFFIQMFDILG